MNKTNHSITNNTLRIVNELADHPMRLDVLSDVHQTLVLDIYGVGDLNLDAWAMRLKQSCTPGAIYAYDHRLDGEVGEGLPEISIMFEQLVGRDGLATLIRIADDLGGPVCDQARQLKMRLLDEAEDAKLVNTRELLSIASAF